MAFLVEFFRVLATVMNVVMFLSPIPTMREIVRTQSTGHMPFVPLVAMVSNAHIWMLYGWLAANWVAIFASCAFGVAAAVVYVAIYYRFTTERAYALKFMLLFAGVITVNTLYAVLGVSGVTGQSDEGVRQVVGYISIASSVVMYTSPLEKIRQVFRHKSAVFIPIQIVVVGAVNSAAWVVFSLLEIDWLVFAPNLFLLVIGLVQIALYWVFHPSKHPLPADADLSNLTVVAAAPKDAIHSRRPSVASFALSPKRDDKDGGDGACFVALRSPLAPLQQV